MSDENPTHGEIVQVLYPAQIRSRKWCALCGIWCWEAGKSYRHGRYRTDECKKANWR